MTDLPAIKIKFNYIAIFLIIFFGSNVLSTSGANPIGISGLQEAFFILLIFFSAIYILFLGKRIEEILIFFVVFFSWFLSAFLAYLQFGQPIFFGLVESRRILSLLIFFPIIYFVKKENNLHFISTSIIITAFICASISVGIYLSSGGLDTIFLEERLNRFAIGQEYIVMAIIILMAKLVRLFLIPNFILAISLFMVLVLIIQTRQLVLAVVLGSFFVIFKSLKVMIVITVSVSLVLLFSSFVTDYLAILGGRFLLLIEDSYLSHSWRSQTIRAIVHDLSGFGFFGFGGLYHDWNDGFARIHGPYFYLADVGLLGSLYRFGIFMVIIYGIFFYYQLKNIKLIKRKTDFNLVLSIFLGFMAISFVSAPIEGRSNAFGMILAFSSLLATNTEVSLLGNMAKKGRRVFWL